MPSLPLGRPSAQTRAAVWSAMRRMSSSLNSTATRMIAASPSLVLTRETCCTRRGSTGCPTGRTRARPSADRSRPRWRRAASSRTGSRRRRCRRANLGPPDAGFPRGGGDPRARGPGPARPPEALLGQDAGQHPPAQPAETSCTLSPGSRWPPVHSIARCWAIVDANRGRTREPLCHQGGSQRPTSPDTGLLTSAEPFRDASLGWC